MAFGSGLCINFQNKPVYSYCLPGGNKLVHLFGQPLHRGQLVQVELGDVRASKAVRYVSRALFLFPEPKYKILKGQFNIFFIISQFNSDGTW